MSQPLPSTPAPLSAKTVIGWAEYVSLPDFSIENLKAKVDTGARTSALHVENLTKLPGGRVSFEVVHGRRRNLQRTLVEAQALRWANVKSSTGETTKRCFIGTRLRLGPVEKWIEVSLVSREKMLFRMLLGRKALEEDFLVNVSSRGVFAKQRGNA